ncbi:MAG: phage holin family protein [Duncaniella sp.]|nr:phage holin family protein [Duncaniella sp.]
MKSFGKGLFWIGFILLMGVVIAYMITMFVGVVALASWTTAVTFGALIIVGGIFMLIGRASERRGEMKRFIENEKKDIATAEKNASAAVADSSASTTTSSSQIQ